MVDMQEKELNCMLIDQLAMLERLEKVAANQDKNEVLDAIATEKKVVNMKLYQKPPTDK